MHPESNELVESIRRGDEKASIRLIELFYERVFSFLRRFTGNEADAADLTQRTFSRVWKSLPSFAGRASLSSWIHGIAYHTYVDWRRALRPPQEKSAEWWSGQTSGELHPDEIVARTDLSAAVYAMVDAFEPDLRDCIHLHYYQELTLEETAEAMGLATSTVKYRIRQAMAELQKRFADKPVMKSS